MSKLQKYIVLFALFIVPLIFYIYLWKKQGPGRGGLVSQYQDFKMVNIKNLDFKNFKEVNI